MLGKRNMDMCAYLFIRRQASKTGRRNSKGTFKSYATFYLCAI